MAISSRGSHSEKRGRQGLGRAGGPFGPSFFSLKLCTRGYPRRDKTQTPTQTHPGARRGRQRGAYLPALVLSALASRRSTLADFITLSRANDSFQSPSPTNTERCTPPSPGSHRPLLSTLNNLPLTSKKGEERRACVCFGDPARATCQPNARDARKLSWIFTRISPRHDLPLLSVSPQVPCSPSSFAILCVSPAFARRKKWGFREVTSRKVEGWHSDGRGGGRNLNFLKVF